MIKKIVLVFFSVFFFVSIPSYSLTIVNNEPNFYVVKQGDIFFVVEKIERLSQFHTWKIYLRNHSAFGGKWARQFEKQFDSDRARIFMHDILFGMSAFYGPIRYYDKSDIYVAYATSKKPESPIEVKEFSILDEMLEKPDNSPHKKEYIKKVFELVDEYFRSIEMTVSVASNEDAPFFLLSGVSRNLKYILAENPQHKKLSHQLFSFVANWSQNFYPEKKYLLTVPMKNMAHNLKSRLPREVLSIGNDPNHGGQVFVLGKTILQENRYVTGNPFMFYLYDKLGQEIFSIDYESANKDLKYAWFMDAISMSSGDPFFVLDTKKLNVIFSENKNQKNEPTSLFSGIFLRIDRAYAWVKNWFRRALIN